MIREKEKARNVNKKDEKKKYVNKRKCGQTKYEYKTLVEFD